MNSINEQQPEDNFKDLRGEEGKRKIKELAEKAQICFFCTNLQQEPFDTRPMSVQEVDDDGNLWFLSANDSHLSEQIAANSSVQLLFQGSSYSDFLNLYGEATASTDKERIHELWQPILKTWFTEGENDPRILVIRVRPIQSYYWDTKHNQAVGLVKRAVGAMVGKTLDDSIEGTIR